jgi:hypothetical protein
MRILWIEDERLTLDRKDNFFGVFAKDHEVKIDDDFSSAYARVTNHLRQYDVLVIDIALTLSEKKNKLIGDFANQFGLTTDKFLQEAGFLIYLKALSQGFPQERMVFLTANMSPNKMSRAIINLRNAMDSPDDAVWDQAVNDVRQLLPLEQHPRFNQILAEDENETFTFLDKWRDNMPEENYENTYEIFTKRFKDARITPPKAVDKKAPDGGSLELQNWLRRHCERTEDNRPDYDYLTLRRGILDVITDLQQSLTKDFQELDKQTFLKGLEWQLRDLALPKEDYSEVYFALCDYLTKPYDIYKAGDLSEDPFRHLRLPLKLPLSNLRNWIAHGLIMGSNTKISAQVAGVTFLIAMQSLFDVKHYGFQDELKRLFSVKTVTETDPHEKIKQQLKSLLIDYKREDPQKAFRKVPLKPLKVLYKKGQKENPRWPQENYLRHFYATYLFSIQNEDYSINRDTDTELNAIVSHELDEVNRAISAGQR